MLGRDDPCHCRNDAKKVMLWARAFNGGRGREHWDVLELNSPPSIDLFGKFQPFQDPPSPCQNSAVHGLMSEVCHGQGREMGQLSASAVSPVPETEMGFNGEQSATAFPTWLCDTLEPGANHPPICARVTARLAGREGCRVPEAWQTEGR